MSNVNKEQWIEHQNHPVTRALKQAIYERIEEAKDQIGASSDPDDDRFLKGMIWAFNEVLEAKLDLTDESEDLNEISPGDTGTQGNY